MYNGAVSGGYGEDCEVVEMDVEVEEVTARTLTDL